MGRFSDFFLFTFDTFNDLTNAYAFGGNSVGVKKDEIFFNGGRTLGEDSNWDWDAKFDLETKIYDNFYTAEIRIPLSSIRFANNSKSWRYNAFRRRIIANEISSGSISFSNSSLSCSSSSPRTSPSYSSSIESHTAMMALVSTLTPILLLAW